VIKSGRQLENPVVRRDFRLTALEMPVDKTCGQFSFQFA
jgi:hypothetical protein